MTQAMLVEYFQRMAWLILLLSAPLLLVSLVSGVIISIFQAVTQIQEQTLSFVPKIVLSMVVFVVTAPWMIDAMVTYTRSILSSLITLGHAV
ncbi:MAG: flagellar biosynthesis protein FliQ [Vampirovibrionales bacterium]|nr:flagellar biosynthesis protein FliQ [Vampirovibrionales bacterium]